MENLPVNNNNGQSYGYTLYETTISSGGTLDSKNNVRDRALVKTARQTPTYNTPAATRSRFLCENIERAVICLLEITALLSELVEYN